MLSNTCKTAVKAVIFLATKYGNGDRSGIKEIAEHIDASEHTVGKMLQILVKQHVINSLKGPSGGFYISADQLHQPILNVVEAIDGKQIFKMCGLGLSRCSATHPCPIHNDYKEARDILEKIFRSKNVIDLCEPVNNGVAYLFG
jgi:Rrf2 family protein